MSRPLLKSLSYCELMIVAEKFFSQEELIYEDIVWINSREMFNVHDVRRSLFHYRIRIRSVSNRSIIDTITMTQCY